MNTKIIISFNYKNRRDTLCSSYTSTWHSMCGDDGEVYRVNEAEANNNDHDLPLPPSAPSLAKCDTNISICANEGNNEFNRGAYSSTILDESPEFGFVDL